jgi:hypothetical protein
VVTCLCIRRKEICSVFTSYKNDYKLYYTITLGKFYKSKERTFDSAERFFFLFSTLIGAPLLLFLPIPLAFLDLSGIDLPHNRTQYF